MEGIRFQNEMKGVKKGGKNGRSVVEMGVEEVKIEREQSKMAVQENNIEG